MKEIKSEPAYLISFFYLDCWEVISEYKFEDEFGTSLYIGVYSIKKAYLKRNLDFFMLDAATVAIV